LADAADRYSLGLLATDPNRTYLLTAWVLASQYSLTGLLQVSSQLQLTLSGRSIPVQANGRSNRFRVMPIAMQ
jgi:hypothetical protein